jgi:hypothetical protein
MCEILEALFERGVAVGIDLAHLNIRPAYISVDHYIG